MSRAVSLLIALALVGVSCGAPPTRTVTIGALPPGTSWYVFAATLSELLSETLPDEVRVEIRPRGGGVGNPILVDRQEVTVAIAQAATSAWATAGVEVYDKPAENIRALVGGLNSVWMIGVLSEAYIERTGNETLEAVLTSGDAVRIVVKPRGSSVPAFVDLAFEAFGLTRDDIRSNGGSIIQVSASQVPGLMRDGRADLYFESGVRGHPTLTEVATTVPVRFLDVPPIVRKRLEGPGVELTEMPLWFPSQKSPVPSVDMGTVLIANRALEDDLAYLITKTVCENREAMAKAHKAWASFDPTNAWRIEKTGAPLHPGAERYYREQGWLE